jgi:hypothetical protein
LYFCISVDFEWSFVSKIENGPHASLKAHKALPISSRGSRPAAPVIPPKEKRTQDGVNPLDGGDADAADAVEMGRLQVLDVVKLGELAAVVGRHELLKLIRAAGAHLSGLSFG